ncbi:MAG: efflux RND transporter periplasmic adaptor subunit [Lachnospiraceae bacterium]|nr:efflux RND transporter periplasmic adaptor subunit [Lachnospiraceae bacterium]
MKKLFKGKEKDPIADILPIEEDKKVESASDGSEEGKTPAENNASADKETGAENGQAAADTDAAKEPAAPAASSAPAYIPGKKKGRWKWIILAVILVLVVAFFIIRGRAAKNAATPVNVMEAANGSIEETVTISGTVASAEKKSYYSTVTAPIATLDIKAGERVKKGDMLFCYNTEDLDLMKKQAELNLQQADGSYSAAAEKNAKATDILRGNSIHDINNRLEEITAEVDAINLKIQEKTDRMSGTVTELQNTLQDIDQNGIADSMETAYAAATGEAPDTDYITRRENGDSSLSESNRQMFLAVQQSLNDKQYALQHDPEIEKWQLQITALNEEKARLTEQKTIESSKLTGGDWNQLKATRELAELNANDTIADIENVESGIKADFGGVVTNVGVEEGATVTKGTRILSIESTDKVEITFQISKVDMTKVKTGQQVEITVNGIPYEGEVIRISGSATKNASGVPVVDAAIRVKNPDDQLILGVEASNKIHTNHAEDVIVLPYEYVGADSEGDFVYVVEDGVAKRRSVTVGLSTSTEAEIREGLSAGELVITDDVDKLTDGQAVTIIPAESK